MVNTYEINGVEYEFEAILKCGDDELSINKNAIKRMELRDCIFDPFSRGNIVLANSYDLLEEDILIRGDGSEILSIKFKPKEDNDNIQQYTHSFSILDGANFGNPNTRGNNLRYYELMDIDLLPFNWLIPYNKEYRGSVGDILKEIFIEVLGEDFVNEDEWESGDFKLSYIPPAHFRYIDLLHYMMRHFCVGDGDIFVKGFIYKNGDDKYELKSVSKIYSENVDLVADAFIISDIGGDGDTINSNNPPPEAEYSIYNNQLRNFQVSTPLYNWNSNYFLSYLIHGYDPIMGTHKMVKIGVNDLIDRWSPLFVDVFKTILDKPKAFLPISELSEKTFKRISTPYPIEWFVRLAEAEISNTLIFYNLQCSFESRGVGGRKAGTFFDVVKTGKEEIQGDSKAIGRWFLTEVVHQFTESSYINVLYGCKTYAGPKAKID